MCATSFSRFTQRSLRLRRADSRCHRISSHASPEASTTLLRPQLLCFLPVGADYRAGSPTGKAPPFRDARQMRTSGSWILVDKAAESVHSHRPDAPALFCFSERVARTAFEIKRKGRVLFISLNLLRPGRARSPVRVSSGYQCRAPNPIPRSGPRRHGRDVAPALDTDFRKTDSLHNRWS